MSIKDKFHDQSTIKITVLKIDGKKLTKSNIEQFNEYQIFDDNYNLRYDKIFGYVKMPIRVNGKFYSYWMIGEKNGKIAKCSFDNYLRRSNLDLETEVSTNRKYDIARLLANVKHYIKADYLDEDGEFYEKNVPAGILYREIIKDEILTTFESNLIKLKDFINELKEHQIII
ncbi:hypothetical protein OMO38_10375 [Chryseobacterium sp. 09-1422]|uniref:Uncharacterized protein n=1 Tax=Chryseobacterium kimseyorum TaxID=2984028 RepID=A0ABT3HYS4_9FLAO|nr:hypothetical protein [Chryseobacterium kimseyorum]MCW3168927.1 hypothetical protein [Chryseobacterium kimseyorum]